MLSIFKTDIVPLGHKNFSLIGFELASGTSMLTSLARMCTGTFDLLFSAAFAGIRYSVKRPFSLVLCGSAALHHNVSVERSGRIRFRDDNVSAESRAVHTWGQQSQLGSTWPSR